jgi:hypothetical protein
VTDLDFKSECHEEIVRRFDPEAEVDFRGYGYYEVITEITFSDGSELHLNYKGEVA